jgi:hypothetical protein
MGRTTKMAIAAMTRSPTIPAMMRVFEEDPAPDGDAGT